MRSLSLNSRAMLSTVAASSSQYLHQVVQNSNSTTLPFTDSLLNCAPLVVLARKRGAGWPVSSPAEQKSVSKRRVLICSTRPVADARMARTISQRIEVARQQAGAFRFLEQGQQSKFIRMRRDLLCAPRGGHLCRPKPLRTKLLRTTARGGCLPLMAG